MTLLSPIGKKALIIGISGQDGVYLSKFLLSKGYEVFGTSRNISDDRIDALKSFDLLEKINLIKADPSNFIDVLAFVKDVEPDEIYNLSGQSSVGLSFDKPLETFSSIALATINILEAIRITNKNIKFYNAGSGEMFGNTGDKAAVEETPLNPVSPYGHAKASATMQVSSYRSTYGMHACTGILFNHESPLRPEQYVTQKIIRAACRIGSGSNEKLLLGNINISRDWGYAAEYVEAMWAMLQCDEPQDIIVATGHTSSLEYLTQKAFHYFNLDWKDHVKVDKTLLRDSEIITGIADPSKAESILGWKASYSLDDVINIMIKDTLKSEEFL
jgi:GDPmannose 4,6-dehydratase